MTAINTENLGLEVPASSVDKELKKLWAADEATTNASLMNLLIYTEKPEDLASNSASISELTREHACRAVLVAMDREAQEASSRAWIKAHCHLAYGKKTVCCEQVSFLLTARAVGRLRNTIFSHLSSDLPLVAWWQADLSGLSERLARLMDRLIVDSASWPDLRAGFERIEELRALRSSGFVVQDLSWTRSFHYRTAVAGLFDDPLAQRSIQSINKVKVVAHPSQRAGALLLVAWLATQAGWKRGLELPLAEEHREDKGLSYFFETKQGNPVEVLVEWSESSAPIGLLEISAPDCLVRVEREKGSKYLLQRLEAGSHVVELNGPADEDDSVGLLASQLSRGGKNSLFQKVLPTFIELLK